MSNYKLTQQLPIDDLLPHIVETVRSNSITLLEAEPGAGKTTRVPRALLQAGLEHVYVLEPRRIAARMAARRVAEEMHEAVGATVGYQVRYEEQSSPHTRLWFFTEGVLTRKLLQDRTLRRAQVVILDEFHERHLETDLALALLRNLQKQRSDLRVVIMSATLAGGALAAKLGDPPLIQAPGRTYPVSVRYSPHSGSPLEEQVAAAIPDTKGHVLVFLPGAAEIRNTIAACEPLARKTGSKLLPLHGELSPEEQDAAVSPSDTRKIICSTNVAESSVTIEGVDAVIDTGLARVLSHSPWSGLSRLRIEKVSQSSAIQRAGRAGRTGPGIAVRLYPESDFVRRPHHIPPEIQRADLAQLLLQVSAYGLQWEDLTWLDEPAPEALQHARELLRALHADASMGTLPVHPRLARLVITGAKLGAKREAADLAARLSEGRLRLDEAERGRFHSDIDLLLTQRPSYAASRLARQLNVEVTQKTSHSHGLEIAIMSAFPDRIARRKGETLLLANGGSAKLDRFSTVASEYLVGIEVEDRDGSTPVVRIACPIEADWLLDVFPEQVTFCEELVWNREAERVEQVSALRYQQLVIDDSRGAPSDLQLASRLLAEQAAQAGPERFCDKEELERLLCRVRFAAQYIADVPESIVSDALQLIATGATSFAEMRKNDLIGMVQSMLPMRAIDEIAPTHIALPSGRRAKIEYNEGRPPSVASRLQDFFEMTQTPRIAKGAVSLVVELLAPNHRPVQVTTDLGSFWANLYPQVRRELSRRYPKHAWPDNPHQRFKVPV